MRIFVTGTDTGVGKTIVSSWLCLHTAATYVKPIQTGSQEGRDRHVLAKLAGVPTDPESYCYAAPLSPHLAARCVGETIDLETIRLPEADPLVVEGAGGILVPLTERALMVDLIARFSLPVLLVASTRLGTLNHTLLTLEALRKRGIVPLGVVLVENEPQADEVKTPLPLLKESITFYGQISVLATLPYSPVLSREALRQIPLSKSLREIFGVQNDAAPL